jgi:hypothetical protein
MTLRMTGKKLWMFLASSSRSAVVQSPRAGRRVRPRARRRRSSRRVIPARRTSRSPVSAAPRSRPRPPRLRRRRRRLIRRLRDPRGLAARVGASPLQNRRSLDGEGCRSDRSSQEARPRRRPPRGWCTIRRPPCRRRKRRRPATPSSSSRNSRGLRIHARWLDLRRAHARRGAARDHAHARRDETPGERADWAPSSTPRWTSPIAREMRATARPLDGGCDGCARIRRRHSAARTKLGAARLRV